MSSHSGPSAYTALCIAAILIVGASFIEPTPAQAQPPGDLASLLDDVYHAIHDNARVTYRGYEKRRKERVEVERLGCNLRVKRTILGKPRPARAVRPFIQFFTIPLGRVQADQIKRVDYQHDVRLGKLEYFGYSVILTTKFWDIEVENRLDDAITRERTFELRFRTEKAAREFAALSAEVAQACAIASRGAGENWNRIPSP